MRNKAGMKFDCIFEETLDFIDIDYTHLNKTIRYEQRPHGHWVYGKCLDGSEYCHCSECNMSAQYDSYGNYEESDWCPNCGADMKEGEVE